MSDSYGDPQQNSRSFDARRGGGRASRPPGNREGGGFRIRLSDNEMRSARSLQEAFNLRSTVAVLGFALRTLGQLLEEGKLDDLIREYKDQGHNNNRRNQDGRSQRFNSQRQPASSTVKVNPFERPSKPSPSEKSSESQLEESQKEEDSKEKNQADGISNDSIEKG